MTSPLTRHPGDEKSAGVPPGYRDSKARHLARLRKVEGQVHGVARMVDDDRYCIDVLTQISAVTRALHEVALGLLDDHMRHCLADAAGVETNAKIDEIVVAVRRAVP